MTVRHHQCIEPLRRGRRRRLAAGVMLAAGAVAVAGCGGGSTDAAVVADVWSVPVDDSTAAVYATITAASTDKLTGGHVDRDVARRVEIVNPAEAAAGQPGHLGHLDPGGSLNDDHSHTVRLRADTPVTLEPGEAHLALDLLASPLEPGDTFEMTFTFDDGPDVRTEVTVRNPSP
jgi:copper(I)-binding protein